MKASPKSTGRKGARRISPAAQILDAMVGTDSNRREQAERAVIEAVIGQAVYDSRTTAGLSHAQLAKRVGCKAGVVRDVEDANSSEPLLWTLRQIADALGKRDEVRLVDA